MFSNLQIFIYEVVVILPLLLMVIWTFNYMDGLDLKSNKDNWHPVFMLAGMVFCFFNGELFLAHLSNPFII